MDVIIRRSENWSCCKVKYTLLHFRQKVVLQIEIVLICTWTINYAFDSEMHKAAFVCYFSKLHVEKLNHPSHLSDAHYLVVVFFRRQLVISLPVFGARGRGRKGRQEGVSVVGQPSWFIRANFTIFLRYLLICGKLKLYSED